MNKIIGMPLRRPVITIAAIFATILAAFSAGGSLETSEPVTTAAEVAAEQQ